MEARVGICVGCWVKILFSLFYSGCGEDDPFVVDRSKRCIAATIGGEGGGGERGSKRRVWDPLSWVESL